MIAEGAGSTGVAAAAGGDAVIGSDSPAATLASGKMPPFTQALAVWSEAQVGIPLSETTDQKSIASGPTSSDGTSSDGTSSGGTSIDTASSALVGTTDSQSSDSPAASLAAVLQWLQHYGGAIALTGYGSIVAGAPKSNHGAQDLLSSTLPGATLLSSSSAIAANASLGSSESTATPPNVSTLAESAIKTEVPVSSLNTGAGTSFNAGTSVNAGSSLTAVNLLTSAVPFIKSSTAPNSDLATLVQASATLAGEPVVANSVVQTFASGSTGHSVEISVPVHDRRWPQALAAQVIMLSDAKVHSATLRLSPDHLGPVEIRIDLQKTQIDVIFTAAQAETRSALEQSLPQLRAVLAGAGLTLGQATVQQQARQGSQNSGNRGGVEPAAPDLPTIAPTARLMNMIDEYV